MLKVLRENGAWWLPRCACGIPNRANWHVHVVLGREVCVDGTETTYTDIYVCTEHYSDWDTRGMLNWDSTGWAILEQKHTELR